MSSSLSLETDGKRFGPRRQATGTFRNPNKGGLVTVPFHRKDLPKGTLHSICKQAGITKEELAAML